MASSWKTKTMCDYANDIVMHHLAVAPAPGGDPRAALAEATADKARVSSLWRDRPGAGIALATGGRFGTLALEFDGPGGEQAKASLEARYGPLPRTPTIAHPDGTLTCIYSVPAAARIVTSTSLDGLPIHVHGDDSAVLLPPSQTPDGQKLEWEYSLNQLEPVEAPASLLDLVSKPALTRRSSTTTAVGTVAVATPADASAIADGGSVPTEKNAVNGRSASGDERNGRHRSSEPDNYAAIADAGVTDVDAVATSIAPVAPRSTKTPTPAAKDQVAPETGDGEQSAVDTSAEPNTAPVSSNNANNTTAVPPVVRLVAIDEIKVGVRYRKKLTNIASLAASIQKCGLLHPPPVTADLELIAGRRRLAACRLLQWTHMPVFVVAEINDACLHLQAERDENVCRVPLLRSEAVALAAALEAQERLRAKERQRQHGGTAPGRRRNSGGKSSPVSPKLKTRDVISRAVDMSPPTLRKAKAVVDAAKAHPNQHAATLAKMDQTGNVEAAYRAIQGQGPEKVKQGRLTTPKGQQPGSVPATNEPATFAVPKLVNDVLVEGLGAFLGLEESRKLRHGLDVYITAQLLKAAQQRAAEGNKNKEETPRRQPRSTAQRVAKRNPHKPKPPQRRVAKANKESTPRHRPKVMTTGQETKRNSKRKNRLPDWVKSGEQLFED